MTGGSGLVKKILKYVGYAVLFLTCVLLFMVLTFPMGKVKTYIEHVARAKLGMEVTIGQLELVGISGLEMQDVLIQLRRKTESEPSPDEEKNGPRAAGQPKTFGTERDASQGDKVVGARPDAPLNGQSGSLLMHNGATTARPTNPGTPGSKSASGAADNAKKVEKPKKYISMHLARIEAHIGLWAILFGDGMDVTFEADLFGGTIRDGHISYSQKAGDAGPEGRIRELRIDLPEIQDIDLRQAAIVEAWLDAALQGRLSGNLELALHIGGRGKESAVDWAESRASGSLTVAKARLRQLQLRTKMHTMELRDVKLGTLTLRGRLDKRSNIPELNPKSGDRSTVIHLAEIATKGGDFEAEVQDTSNITIQKGKPFNMAYLNLRLQFKLADAFKAYLDGDPEPTPAKNIKTYILGQSRDWRTAENNGYYGYQCVSPIKDIRQRCRPVPPFGERARGRAGAAEADQGGGEKTPTETKGRPSHIVKPTQPKTTVGGTVQGGHTVRTERNENLRTLPSATGAPSVRPTTVRGDRPISRPIGSYPPQPHPAATPGENPETQPEALPGEPEMPQPEAGIEPGGVEEVPTEEPGQEEVPAEGGEEQPEEPGAPEPGEGE